MPPRAQPDLGESDSVQLEQPPLEESPQNAASRQQLPSSEDSSTSNGSSGGVLRFTMCALGICICYMYYGMLQERLFRHHDSSTTTIGPSFVLLLQCLANVGVALLWQRIERAITHKPPAVTVTDDTTTTSTTSLHYSLLALTSMCYVLAMVCSNEALHFVSYPTAVLAKSCKLIPTMAMGVLVEHRVYSKLEWTAALCITVGIVLFNLSRLSNRQNNSEDEASSARGLVLLSMSLFFDGLLGSSQGLLKQTTSNESLVTILFFKRKNTATKSQDPVRPPNAVETMLYVNLYALVWLLPMTILNQQFQQGLELMRIDATFPHDDSRRFALAWGLSALTATVAVGQIFIFLTITWYSSLVCSTITTTRKFFTILLSVSYFGHSFSAVQWMSIGFVFSGLYLGIVAGRQKQQLHASQPGAAMESKSSSAMDTSDGQNRRRLKRE